MPRPQTGRNTGILAMDPPDHTRLRTLVAKAFTVRRVAELRPRAREIAASLVKGMIDTGPPIDLVDRFALPLPVAVICELLGVPVEDRPKFRVWSDNILSTSQLTAEQFVASQQEMHDYLLGLIAEHRAAPRDDLMTALIEARDAQDRLSELELVMLCRAILVAGHETTASQIPNFVLTLLDRPETMAKLRADLSLLPGAVDELMRFIPLTIGGLFARYASEDVQVGDVLVRAGEPVVVTVSAANRDALRFDDPATLRLDRPSVPHLAFGHGIHHCLGAALARMELQEALRVLLTELPGLRLVGVTWKTGMVLRSPARMQVGW